MEKLLTKLQIKTENKLFSKRKLDDNENQTINQNKLIIFINYLHLI